MFDGDPSGPTGTLPNNSFVISRPDNSSGFRFRFVCRSIQTGGGKILGTGGRVLMRFTISTSESNKPVEVLVSNKAGKDGEEPITSAEQGVYTCDLNGTSADLSIGIYLNSFEIGKALKIAVTVWYICYYGRS